MNKRRRFKAKARRAATRQTWGLFDTVDHVWMGGETGPRTYDTLLLARLAAEMVDVMIRQEPGRTRARRIPRGPWRQRDSKAAHFRPAAALDRLERGLF